jgi:hypothetical protein
MKNNINNIQKMTLATLAVGAALAPIQTALSHGSLDTNSGDGSGVVKLQVEQHPHPPNPGSLNDHYIDPRSIRAVGYDTGKSDRNKGDRDNWEFYNQRMM